MEFKDKYEVTNRNDNDVKYEIEVKNNEFPYFIFIEQNQDLGSCNIINLRI
jgi:hypothetical protein